MHHLHEIFDLLRSLGLREGDDLLVHSSYRSLGPVENGPEGMLDVLLQVVGSRGHLMMPAFNYSFPLPVPYFDQKTTPSRTGILCELARHRGVRSLHPTHSVAAIGPDAEDLTAGHLEVRAFGLGSPIDRLARRGGKILLLGVGQTSNSTIHVGEEYAALPKVPKGGSGVQLYASVRHLDGRIVEHPLDSSPSCSAAFGVLEATLREEGVIQDAVLGDCLIQCMSGSAVISCTERLISTNPRALLCARPGCASCRGVESNLLASGR